MTYLDQLHSFEQAELHALRNDGELTPYFHFLDTADDVHARSARILGNLCDVLVLSSWSAAWAYGCCVAPPRHTVSYRRGRTHVPDGVDFAVEQRTLLADDINVNTTTPLRTVADVLKIREHQDAVLMTTHNVMSRYKLTRTLVLSHVDRNKTAPYRTLICSRLDKLAELYPSETRYTS